jgi:SAM-dependent methyltransferase/outer membrane murein-binding lipoprotein Lpp
VATEPTAADPDRRFERTVTPEDLTRLRAEREEADRRYNDALSALDRAIMRPGGLPHPPPPPGEGQLPRLDALAALADRRLPGGGRGLVARLVRRVLAPYLTQQQAFNLTLIEHLRQALAHAQQLPASVTATIDRLREALERLEGFQSQLILYLQQVTPFVDTKDREVAGLARRVHEDNRELIDLIEHRTLGLAGAISGVSDELLKRWESMSSRDERLTARVDALHQAHEALRASLAAVHQATHTIKRELERLPAAPSEGRTLGETAAQATGHEAASSPLLASNLDAYKYVGFEDRFRGSPEEIRERMADYVDLFEGARDVLDVGCGRGEFLDLLRARGIEARGLDVNHEMVEICRARGLRVDEGDALGYLQALPDASLGGLMSAQVVEHLRPDYLLRLLETAFHKLRPGSRIVLETINPTCWFAFFQSYLRDLTHVQPVHPDTLAYFLTAIGFQKVEVRYRAPFPEHEKLQRVPSDVPSGDTLNANVDRLNHLLFTHLDYAAIGERL